MSTNINRAIIADTIQSFRDRVATCKIYTGRTNSLTSHNWVVVSDMDNQRLAYVHGAHPDGGDQVAVTMKSMPTCWTRKDADELARDLTAQFITEGKTERMSVIAARDWWAIEQAAAQGVLDFIESEAAAA